MEPVQPIIRPAGLHRFMRTPTHLAMALVAIAVAGCSSVPKSGAPAAPTATGPIVAGKPGYYKDDGPGANPPANLEAIPDAVPRLEALSRTANRPYTALGREYVPETSLRPYRDRGVASWYGRRYHGAKTSIGEVYDMYAMTAAHPTLALPSYAKVTSVKTGKSVIVRVNDRGPFLHDRIIDLSYAAAFRIGIAQAGSGEVEVEAIIPSGLAVAPSTPLPPVAAAAASVPRPAPTALPSAAAPAAVIEAPPATVGRAPGATPPAPGSGDVALGSSGRITVQMGAFGDQANAQTFLRRMQNQLTDAGVELSIRQVNGLFRVFVGPYADRGEAQRVAQRLASDYGVTTTIAIY